MRATVIYDGDCGLCNKIRETISTLDWLDTMRWIPLQSAEARQYGIPREELERSMYVITENGRQNGWEAVKRILLRLPMTYLLAGAAIRKSPWAALAVAALLSPLANPVGDRAYQIVARNRKLFPGATCGVPV